MEARRERARSGSPHLQLGGFIVTSGVTAKDRLVIREPREALAEFHRSVDFERVFVFDFSPDIEPPGDTTFQLFVVVGTTAVMIFS
jgi:hypothetical protein